MATRTIRDSIVTLVRAPLISRVGSFNNEATPHIGMAYVAGYLRQAGYRVAIVDGIKEGLNEQHPLADLPGFQIQGIPLEDLVARIPPDTRVIGFSSMFSAEWVLLRSLITMTRQRFPDSFLVGGGEHFTALPEYCLRDCPALDVIVKGEGEHTFFELLEGVGSDTGDYTQVSGICFLDGDDAFRDNGGLPRIRAVDRIPWPYWPDGYLEAYWAAGKSYGISSGRDMPLLATRGCPYRCTFCSSPQMWSTRYVMRDVEDVLAEIKYYVEKYRITSFQLYDLTVFTKKRWTVQFCKRLLEENIQVRWSLPSGTRSEVLDEEVIRLLKATGCDYIAYAPESGSARTLEKIKKRVNLDSMVASIRMAKKIGLVVRINLIIGFPHETRKDVWQTVWFGLRNAMRGVDEVPLFIYSAYPGTEIFARLREKGVVELNDEYFLSLISFNGKMSALRPKGVTSRHIPAFELACVRLIFVLLNYLVGYLLYPARIVRTVRNLLSGNSAATVFEHRLRDALSRRRIAARASLRATPQE
jgi:anaerobic magnesium-protoporphyrin IX monomethyl ester cyclase